MEADIDFDVIAHLGHIKNIDVQSRGYFYAGFHDNNEQKIAPIGLFSAPSRLDSFVAQQRVPPPPFLNVCHIDNDDQTFRCRSFVIRYRDEKHELNDGVHWRLTIPAVDLLEWRGGIELLSSEKNLCDGAAPTNAPSSPGGLLFDDLLQIHCELFHAPLLDVPPDLNMMFDVAQVIPKNPVFDVVSSQRVIIQNHGWAGFHEYFPVHFERTHTVDLDMMVHCGITDIKYTKMSFSVLPVAERAIHGKHNLQPEDSVESSGPSDTDISPGLRKGDTAVGSVAVQDTNGKEKLEGIENTREATEEYPAGIGIWYTKSNIDFNELSPDSGAQPVKSQNIIEAYLTPPDVDYKNVTPEKQTSPFENVVFDTPPQTTEQYYDDGEDEDVTPTKRSSYKPPRKSFTPRASGTLHRKGKSMPTFDSFLGESGDVSGISDEVILADDLTNSNPSSPLPSMSKTPASRRSFQPARKSFTPGPGSVSARKSVREGVKESAPLSNLFSNTKASPQAISMDPSFRRDLLDEDSLPPHSVNSIHARTAQTGYSYDQAFDSAMMEESLRDIAVNIEFPTFDEVERTNPLIEGSQTAYDSRSSVLDIQVPVIHTLTPSERDADCSDRLKNDNIFPLVLRHQITTVVERRMSDRIDVSKTPPVANGTAQSRVNFESSPLTSTGSREMAKESTAQYSDKSTKSSVPPSTDISPVGRPNRSRSGDGILSYGCAFDGENDNHAPSPYLSAGDALINKSKKANVSRRITACGVELDDAYALLCSYLGPVAANHSKLSAGMDWILKILSKQSCKSPDMSESSSVVTKNGIAVLTADLTERMMKSESISLLKGHMIHHVNGASLDVCAGIWKQLFVALPKVMPTLLSILKKRYMRIMHGFWKEQMMVHTCRDTSMTKMHPAEASAAQLLEAMLRIESQQGYIAAGYQYPKEYGDSDSAKAETREQIPPVTPADDESIVVRPFSKEVTTALLSPPLIIESYYQPLRGDKPAYRGFFGDDDSSSVSSPHFYLPGRGMRLFDSAVHKMPNKLPIIVIQQYISQRKLGETTPPKLAVYKPREGIQRGGPLIGVEPTALAVAMKLQRKFQPVNSTRRNDSQLNSVTMSLKNEFSEDKDERNAIRVADESEFVVPPASGLVGSSINDLEAPESMISPYRLASVYDDENEESENDVKSKGVHIIILQHGFKGCAYDMRLIRNAITIMFPENTIVYAAEANEKESEVSIELMGQRLAIEVHQFIKTREPKILKDPLRGKVSFIGHSVGGLIIRKALESELLKPLLCKLHLYLSLASPHLGTLYADSQLVASGMWALFKLQKAAVLRELSLDDVHRGDMTKSLLYRLSENGVLMYFKWVAFASSPKDQYVPHYSARSQVSSKAVADARTGPAIVSMAANVMAQTDPSRLFRVTIDNNTGSGGNINNIIGRTAHICYLDNPVVVNQLMYSLCSFFP